MKQPAAPAAFSLSAKRFSRVHEELYRGAIPSRSDIETLAAQGFSTVLDFSIQVNPHERKWVEGLGMTYVNLPWSAYWYRSVFYGYYSRIAQKFLSLAADKGLRPMFIHCFHGRERTGMLVAIYRMYVQGWSLQRAVDEMVSFGFNKYLHFDLVIFLGRYKRNLDRTLAAAQQKPLKVPGKGMPMKGKLKLSDGRVIEGDQLGKLENGTLVDFSPLKQGGKVKTLGEHGEWTDAGDITGQGDSGFTPLREAEIEALAEKGVVKRLDSKAAKG